MCNENDVRVTIEYYYSLIKNTIHLNHLVLIEESSKPGNDQLRLESSSNLDKSKLVYTVSLPINEPLSPLDHLPLHKNGVLS